MNYMIAVQSDIGIKKNTNQDSGLIKVAETPLGKVCFCLICDGMGGLSSGELASATVVREFDRWFEKSLPNIITASGFDADELKLQWDNIVLEQNRILARYASRKGTRMGTTICAVLFVGNEYYIMNVGDSRAYMIDQQVNLLTKDQTFVQYEMDNGRMTWEEAKVHPQRNVLLQCCGASEVVTPDFYHGYIAPDQVYMVCSDGFRHVITAEEIYHQLNPMILANEQIMNENSVRLIELNKMRRETDNITVALVRTCQGD